MSQVSGPESVVGIISANARLGVGFEQLQLIVTDRRIVVVHKAKKGAGGLASILVLGGHSGVFADPDKPTLALERKKRFRNVDVEKVLASNKDNFTVRYSEMISVELDDGPDATGISLITGEDKFEFFTSVEAREVSGLLEEHLGPRLVTRKRVRR
jgi:hypothetical protein